MTLNIQYISSNNAIEEVKKPSQVKQDASFAWYDYSSFDDKDLLLSHFDDVPEALLEDKTRKIYRPSYFTQDGYQILICHNIRDTDASAKAINILIKKDMIITFHNGDLEDFIDVKSIVETMTEDLEIDIALYILHQAVDQYFEILHRIEDEVIEFEEKHGGEKRNENINSVMFDIKRKIFRVKRVIIPMSELIGKLQEEDIFNSQQSDHIFKHINTKLDRQKLIIQFSEEMVDEIKENYTSYNTYQMNKVINILTIISAIFLPLTLITGIYGMNFTNMPELNLPYGYFITLLIMLSISIGMIIFFKYKRWM